MIDIVISDNNVIVRGERFRIFEYQVQSGWVDEKVAV